MDDYNNQTLNSRYTVLEQLGTGGMATVYKAYDMVDAREVAIKILNSDSLADENMRNRFINEAKAIASVSHPNIVNIYDFYCDENLAYIVMEYIKGISLRDYMKGVGTVEPRDASHFVVQILRALQHAHDAGIYHRDIKPENILILPNASVKVSDFGIAKLTHGKGIEIDDGKNFGSVRYMSPEQITDGDIDGRTDIYSVGIMFYELVTGRLPFDSDNEEDIALMQINTQPERPITYNPSIPVGLEQIILHAIQKNPAYRFSSAASFLVDLNEFRKNNAVRFDYAVEQFPDNEATVANDTEEASEAEAVFGVGDTRPVEVLTDNESDSVLERLNDEIVDDEDVDDEDDEDEEDDGKSNFIPIIIASVVSVVLIVGIIILVVFGGAIRSTVSGSNGSSSFFSKLDVFGWFMGDKVEVPNFINMDFEQVILDYPDLIIENPPQYEYNSTYEDGKVCAQDPEAGSRVDADAVIKLTVAASGEMVLVRDASGMTAEEAESMFKKDGLNVILIPTKDKDKKEGEVISTSPIANSYIAQSGTVFVYYASSVDTDEKVQVPNVTGYSESAAIAKIRAAGLVVGSVTRASSTEAMKGLVVTQSPSGSASVKSGTAVSIIVGSGGLEDDTVSGKNDASFSVVLPSSGGKGTVTVYLNGKLVETKTGVSLNGKKYATTVTGKGEDNSFEVYVDGNLVYSGDIDFTSQTPTFSNVQAYQFTSKTSVPDVTGMSQSSAVDKLKSAGFSRVKVVTESSDKVAKGKVISQTPDSGSQTATTASVTIVVSTGKEETTAEPTTKAPETEAPTEPDETEEPDEPDEPSEDEPSEEPTEATTKAEEKTTKAEEKTTKQSSEDEEEFF